MNLISFANFNISGNQSGILPATEKEGNPEDFSAILNNIFVALQTANSPAPSFSSGFEEIQTVSDGRQNFVLSNNQVLSESLYNQNPRLIVNTENSVSIKTNVNQNILPENLDKKVFLSLPQTDSPASFTPTENRLSIPENFQPVPKLPTMKNVLKETRVEQNLSNIPQNISPEIQNLNTDLPVSSKDFEIVSVSKTDTILPQQNYSSVLPVKSEQNIAPSEVFYNISNLIRENDLPKEKTVSFLTENEPTNLNPSIDKIIQSDLVEKTSIAELVKSTLVENKSTEVKPQSDLPPVFENINLVKPKLANYLNNPETIEKNPIQTTFLPENQRFNQSLNIISNESIQPENTIKIADLETSQNFNFNEKPEKKTGLNEVEKDFSVNFDKVIENAAKDLKVVETNPKAQTEAAKIAEQINPHLLELASLVEKKQEKEILKLRLHPAELGTVEITLERDKSGVLNAHFKTETADAQQALSKGLEQLRDNLQNAGWEVGKMDVSNGSTSTTDNQNQPQHQQTSEWIENFVFSRSSAKPDEAENNSPKRLLNLLA